jgi:hypothetical protein
MILWKTGVADAQNDCTLYVPASKGTKWEITTFTAKNKETGKITYELLEKKSMGPNLTFAIESRFIDTKGKESYAITYEAHCRDGRFEFDMASRIDGNTMEAYKDMEMTMDASDLEVPAMRTPVGTILKDGTLYMTISAGPLSNIRMNVEITDRKVLGKETMQTSAGSFPCLILSQRVKSKIMMFNVEATSKEWYAEGVGMVRSESYDKKGKLTSYSVLTALTKM